MHNIRFNIIMLLGLLSLSACEKTFNTVIDIGVDHTPMTAISITNSTVQQAFKGSITATRAITGPPQGTDVIADADVKIYENGTLRDSMFYDALDLSYLSTQSNWLNGSTYRLVVQAPGKATVEAEDQMPLLVKPLQVNRIPNAKTFVLPEFDNQSVLCDEISFIIPDVAGQKDYYSFEIRGNVQGQIFNVNVICNDAEIESGIDNEDPTSGNTLRFGSLYIRDDLFQDGQKKVVLYLPATPLNQGDYELHFHHISENFYKYSRSYELYLSTQGNPFSEPVQVHSNVKNGAGIFALKQSFVQAL